MHYSAGDGWSIGKQKLIDDINRIGFGGAVTDIHGSVTMVRCVARTQRSWN